MRAPMGTLVLALLSGLAGTEIGALAGTGAVERTVWGEVVAVNVADSPPVIVAKTETGRHQEMIVGATVGPDAVIIRGTHRIGLETIRAGERVRLTYLKNPEGLVTKAIHVR